MVDDFGDVTGPTDPVGRVLYAVTGFVAVAGGLWLVVMAALTSINVVLLKVFNTPIRGEFDIVNLGIGVVVFTFLPYCQLVRGNVVVDFITDWAPARVKALLDAIGCLIYLGLCALLVWRMAIGGVEIHAAGQRTAVLHIPYWWSFVVAVSCLGLLCIVCVYCIWRDLKRTRA